MKKTKSFIAFLLAVVLIVSQCIIVTSYAFASDDEAENGIEATAEVENAEDEEEPEADKIIIGVDGYDFLGDKPYQTLAAIYGAELDSIPFPETLPVSIDGTSELVKLPVEWKLADGEEWDAYSQVYDEEGNLISSKVVADFGEGYVLSEELAENGTMPWINLIHQPKPLVEETAEEGAPAEETAETETKAPVKAPSKVPSKTPAVLSNNIATYASLPSSQQTAYVWYDTTVNAFNVRGVNNGSANIKTTYAESGYTCVFRVDGSDSNVTFGGNGITKTINGMNITQTLSIVNDNAYIKINYDVYNPTTVAHTIGIANHTDVQIGTNDSAPITKTGTGAVMKQGNAATDPQFNIICNNAYGVTDVDTLWFGAYGQRTSHLWTGEKSVGPTSGDSGISIAWYNRVINPGQTKSFSYLLGIGKSANPPELGGEISATVKPQTVDVSANVKDVTGMVDRLYYVLDMGTSDETAPAVLDTKNGNGSFQAMGGSIQRPKSWQAGEVHTVSVWVMNNANAMSAIKTVAIFIEDNEDLGDVMRPAQSATVTFAANGGSGTAPATMNAYELQTISLPNNTFTAPAGKTFGGWQDPSGNVYPAGSDYKVPENLTNHTVQLKAYWINTNESYYYLDIYEEQLNGNYKKTNATITSGTVNTAVNLSASSLTVPEGMKFNASKSKLSGTIVNAANPLHLTAYFDRLDLKVTFDNGISSQANDVVTVKYGATVAESAIKTLANQTYATFGGWFTNIGGKGNAFTSDRKIKDNITVYAYWIPKTVKIDFDYNYKNPRAHNLEARRYSCELTPEAKAGYNLNLAGKISAYPVNPARYQDTNGDTFRFDGWYLGNTKINANTLFNYEPTTVTAKWVKVAAIACVAEGNGTVDGQGFYDLGSDVTVSWTADPGYHVSHIMIDGKWVGGSHVGDTKHDFDNIGENHSVLVRFAKDGEASSGHDHPDVIEPEDKYHLITTHKHGTSKINLTDSFSVKDGEDARVDWSVPSGYKITKILVNGINRDQAIIDRGYGIVENVDQDYTVDVYAEPITNYVQQNGYYNIDTAINHGTITNSASVTEGSAFTVNWEIEAGYHPVSVLIDGVEAEDITAASVSFNDIKENHKVVVKCKADDPAQTPGGDDDNTDDKDLLVNTAIYGGPGSITPSSFVSSGDSTTVKWNITADIPEQYEIGYVYVDGELIPLDEDNNLEYTFDGVADDHKVEVYLIPNLVQFNVSYEGRGNVSPSQTLLYATDYNLVATPESGWTLSKIIMDGKQIYPEQTSMLSRIAAFFSGNDTDAHANQNFEQTYNVVEEHEVKVVFAHEDGNVDSGARVQLNTQLNGTNNGTISPSRLFVAGRDNNDVIEWTVPENYTVESIFARTDKTENLTEISVTGNSLTINDIITALHQTNDSLEVINDIYFIVNAKPVPVVSTADPVEYFDLTTEIDSGGNITSSMNNLVKGEKVTVKWSTDENQWVSKVIIDDVERPDLVEKTSVDLTMDQNHTVKVVLNLAATKYYLDTYLQLTTGEYVLANSYPFDTRVNREIELDPITNGELTIPGYTFNPDKSVLKGTATGLSKPLHVSAYFDRVMNLNVQYVDEDGMEIEEGKYNYAETYKWNDAYKTEEKEIYGYTLTETPENESGRMTNDVTVQYVYALKDSSVVVNYLDENGDKIPAEIQDSTVLNGKVFQPFETEPKEIYSYELDTDRLPVQNGTFEEEEQVVNYYYKLKDSSVVLRFVNVNGEELSPERTIEGKVYEDYTDKAQDILDEVLASDDVYGYQLSRMPLMDNNGKIAESQMTITYVFELKGAVVEVQFVDTDGKEIDDPEILEGTVFDPYTTSPREIRGYTLVKSPDNASGTYIDGKIIVTYCYQANEAYVVVNYKGTDGEKLGTVKLSGRVAQNYTTEAKKFNGYQLTAEPVNAKGKYKVDTITVNYVYAPDDTSLIVNYLNKSGKAVADSIAEYGKFNQHYRTIPKVVYGYELVEIPKNASGKYTQHKVVVNYTYVLKDAVVTANYVDLDGNPLAESETIKGKFFEDYKTKAKTIPGYQLTATPSNSRGEFNADEITVDYVYVPKDTSVIVNYKDTHGKSIETSVALNGKVLEAYTTEAKEIYGYTLVETPENATGIYTDDQIIVDYIYDTKDTKVVVKYVDENGKELAKSDTVKGKVFDEYTTSAKAVYSYKLIADSGNTAGEFTEETITVTYTYKQYLNIDTNGDGKPDVDIDTDGDGKPDTNIDTTGDGKPNVNIDTDGDGKPDVNIDTTGDGKPNVNIDKDGDGKPDVNIDTTGDGKPNVNIDTNGDGKPDLNIDTTGDGKPNLNIDTDGDGKADLNIDTNKDGKPDVNIDTNDDGEPDINIDTNGDGIADANLDTDKDGVADTNLLNPVDTGSNDMFSLVFFSGLAVIALVLLFAICKKSKKVSE